MGVITLTSFIGSTDSLDPDMVRRQNLLHQTALDFGSIDSEIKWTRSDILATEFYRNNKTLLDSPRGCGFWAWKPWIILQTLHQTDPGDYVIYHDVGKGFRAGQRDIGGDNGHGNVIELPVQSVIQWAERHAGIFPGVNTPHYGPASQWTKRDCFVGMDCDTQEFWELPLVQAGYNAWKNSPFVIEFLEKWLAFCCDRRLISDDPNVFGKADLPEFCEHRHDQSVLSNLIRKEGLMAYGSITQSKAYVRNFNYLIRRIGLDLKQERKEPTLTSVVQSAGGSWNLPVSATNWIDLDLSCRRAEELNILYLRASANAEESLIRGVLSDARWRTIDLSRLESGEPENIPICERSQRNMYDWILAYGFDDQALLCELVKAWMPALKPMAFMIAGLDYHHNNSYEQTFAGFIMELAQTRCLKCRNSDGESIALSLVAGSASNPIPLKQRNDKPIIASIQRGLKRNSNN